MRDNETIPGPDREGIPDNDPTARQEYRLVAAGNLQEEEERGRFRRDERLRDVLSGGRVFLFRLLPYALVVVALIMAISGRKNGHGYRRSRLIVSRQRLRAALCQ